MASPSLTPETIAALAPDAASLKAGQKLVSPAKWPTLAQSEGTLWGECQGSGAYPYVVVADLRTGDVATKCSCPSRKFPCKHGLALLLLYAENKGNWSKTPPPDAIQKWLSGRVARVEKGTAKAAAPKEADPAQQAKTWARREKKMSAGLEALELWLADLVREGLLSARKRPYSEWDSQAARMVDAQLPGVARRVREIPGLLHEESGEGLTAHLGTLYLLTQAWKGRDSLSAGERADLLRALGLPLDKDNLRPVRGKWICAGSLREDDDRLQTRRTWMVSETGQSALLLDFAPLTQGFPVSYTPLRRYVGGLGFTESAFPQRAVVLDLAEGNQAELPSPALTLPELAVHWASALAQQPWLERVGVCVGPVYLAGRQVCDLGGHAAPLHPLVDQNALWHLQAEAETRLVNIFGEWDGKSFRPLSLTPVGQG